MCVSKSKRSDTDLVGLFFFFFSVEYNSINSVVGISNEVNGECVHFCT